MGKVEKIVVLSVLFLIVLILAISLNTTPGGANGLPDRRAEELARLTGSRPLGTTPLPTVDAERALIDLDRVAAPSDEQPVGHEERVGPGTRTELAQPGPGLEPGPAHEGRPSEALAFEPDPRTLTAGFQDPRRLDVPADTPGLLSSGVQTPERDENTTQDPAAVPAAPTVALQADWDLQTTAGMVPTALDEFLVYVCVNGDDLTSLATRFYGSADKVDLLQLNNEGITQLVAGTELLVPVRDDRRPVGGGNHLVVEAESLWSIAHRHYGDGTRWTEIFDANRHILAEPKDLRPGMELVLP